MKEAYKAIRLMTTMVIACLSAVFIGNALDTFFHTSPWILFILLGYAIVSSLYLLVKKLGDDDGN